MQIMVKFILMGFMVLTALSLQAPGNFSAKERSMATQKCIFGTYIEDAESKYHVLVLAESLREFGGALSLAEIWAYMPAVALQAEPELNKQLQALHVVLKESSTPEAAQKTCYSGKVFAAAQAEQEIKGNVEFLIWLDEDTIVLREPNLFQLDKRIKLGYCPVMHQNIGSPFDAKPDQFWNALYQKFALPDSVLFPMITVAGKEKIRPYFNAGCLVVRPEVGLMGKWAEFYSQLYQDPVFIQMCVDDVKKRIFLHQAALTAAILKLIPQSDMFQFPVSYNYPIFFDQMFGAPEPYNSLIDVVTMRYDIYFRKPAPDWQQQLKAPPDILNWLGQRLPQRH